MSRIENKIVPFVPYQYDTSLSNTYGARYADQGLYGTDHTSEWAYFTGAGSVSRAWYYIFNVSSIPNVARILSVKYKVLLTVPKQNTLEVSLSNLTNSVSNVSSFSNITKQVSNELDGGTWTISDLQNIRLKLNNISGNKINYFFGADLTITYDLYYYSISTSSSVQGVSISSTSNETLEGGSNTITLSNVSDISTIKVMDNSNDITSLFTRSGSNYTYTLTNINADHTIVVEDNSSPYANSKQYIKKNGSFVESTNQYVKESNSWINRTISKIFWKINGTWSETNVSMSGKTAFKIDV